LVAGQARPRATTSSDHVHRRWLSLPANPRRRRGSFQQHLEQIADLSLLDERMAQGKLRYDLVTVSSALSLAQHVTLLDELGEDPVGAALGDPDRNRDVPQADARIMGHADKDMGVVGQKVPAAGPCLRVRLHISRSYFHESVVDCNLTNAKPEGRVPIAEGEEIAMLILAEFALAQTRPGKGVFWRSP
jgi:hypothetical protein